MQSVSASLDTAIEAQEREPIARVRVDWNADGNFTGTYDDLSDNVESVTVDRSISTDLPDAAKRITGYAAAETTVELAGDSAAGAMGVTRLLSAYDGASPLTAVKRITAPVDIDLGFRTSAGQEWIDALAGKVRSVGIRSGARSVTLTGLDYREKIRTRVTLPVVVADEGGTSVIRPGLDQQWVMDYVLRRNGFYASPPVRASSKLSVPLHGSAIPESGWTQFHADNVFLGPGDEPVTFGAGNFAEAATEMTAHVRLSSTISTTNGSNAFLEGWVYVPATVSIDYYHTVLTYGATDGVAAGITTGKVFRVLLSRSAVGGTVTVNGPTLTTGWHYLAVHVLWGATATVNFRVDGTTTGPVTSGALGATATAIDGCTYQCGEPVSALTKLEAVQVTTEAFSGSMWNDSFVPSAVLEASLGWLTGIPPVWKADPWEILTDLAAAENGVCLFDEAGVFRFYNRLHMSGGAPVATVSSLTNLTDVAAEETVDTVRNTIVVPAQPLKLDPAEHAIWNLAEVISIPASGTRNLWPKFEGAVYDLDTSVISLPAGYTSADGSGYRASKRADGTGGAGNDVSNLTFAVTKFVDNAKVVITNPNAFRVWLVFNSLSPSVSGQPSLRLFGRVLLPAKKADEQGVYSVEATDATSITAYGEQPLEVPETVWLQSALAAETRADFLLAALKDPHPVLTDVEIVADPRLQLCDRVTVVEPDGLALNHEFWIIGITTTLDGAGMTQRLALRQA